MAKSVGVKGKGMTISFGGAAVAQLTRSQSPQRKKSDIDITNADSPDNYKEFLPGVIDPGTSQITAVFTADQALAVQTLINADATCSVVITLPTIGTWTGDGYVNADGDDIPYEDKVIKTLGVKWSGKPVFAKTGA